MYDSTTESMERQISNNDLCMLGISAISLLCSWTMVSAFVPLCLPLPRLLPFIILFFLAAILGVKINNNRNTAILIRLHFCIMMMWLIMLGQMMFFFVSQGESYVMVEHLNFDNNQTVDEHMDMFLKKEFVVSCQYGEIGSLAYSVFAFITAWKKPKLKCKKEEKFTSGALKNT